MDTLVIEDGVTFLAAHGQSFLTRRSRELDVVQQVRAFVESPERSFRRLLD